MHGALAQDAANTVMEDCRNKRKDMTFSNCLGNGGIESQVEGEEGRWAPYSRDGVVLWVLICEDWRQMSLERKIDVGVAVRGEGR